MKHKLASLLAFGLMALIAVGLSLLLGNWSTESSYAPAAMGFPPTASVPAIAATRSYSEFLTIAATDIWSLPTPIHTPIIPTERPRPLRPTHAPMTPYPTPTFLPDQGVRLGEVSQLAVVPDASFPLVSLPRLIYPATDGRTLVGTIRPDEDTDAVVAIDLVSGKMQVLYEAHVPLYKPQVSGRHVVWNSLRQLYFHDLDSGQSGELDSGIVRYARVSGDIVIWQRDANAIWGHDFSTGEDFPVAAHPDIVETLPVISDAWVLYLTPTGDFNSSNLRATSIRTQEDIHIAEIPLRGERGDEPYLRSVYAIDVPWVAWASEAELHLYNLDSRAAYTVPVEACIHPLTTSSGSVLTERWKPAHLALSENTLIFACGQRMGYDIERGVFFSLPLRSPETANGEIEDWAISGNRLVWVLSFDSWGEEESRIYTARIERSP